MKIIFSLVLFTAAITCYGQGPTFESLTLTSAPAYNILGVDPQNIQRPSTPSDLIAGAQSALVNGKLQPNFAIEATPYYWKHPKTAAAKQSSLYKFLNYKNNVLDNIYKTFTFSFASSDSDTLTFGGLDPGIGFGVGVKFNLFNGNVSRKTIVQISSLLENKLIYNLYQVIMGRLQVDENVVVSSRISAWKNDKLNTYSSDSDLINLVAEFVRKDIGKARLTPNDINFLQKKINKISEKETSVLSTLNEAVFPLTREGFMLEVAIADGAVVQNNVWASTANAKTSIWLTPSYRFNTRKDPSVINFLDVMGVFRKVWNSSLVDSSDYLDFGGKLQYTHNKISISGEYIARMLNDKPVNATSKWTNRLDFSFDYKLSSSITFKATFGRNFDGTSVQYSDPGKMFAVGGLNFGFGDFLKMND